MKFLKNILVVSFVAVLLTGCSNVTSVESVEQTQNSAEQKSEDILQKVPNKASNTNMDIVNDENNLTKTIDIFYASLQDVPEYYYYEEYRENKQAWYGKNLARYSVEQINEHSYKVVFSGVLEEIQK